VSGRRAIVTLAIGAEFSNRWHRHCEPNWRQYAERHGYELICIEEPLDDSPRARARNPAWQKLLIPGLPWAADYERLVWIDADVLFGPDAPDIAEGVPLERIGAVDEMAELDPDIERMLYQRPRSQYYRDCGIEADLDSIVQSGTMVLSPAHHREVFEHVYRTYEERYGTFYEMRPLSYELLTADLVSWIDPRFNRLWIVYRARHDPALLEPKRHPRSRLLARQALSESYCLHFAGEAGAMDHFLEPEPTATRRREPARTPVVLFMYERPDTTARVLDAVREARPERLLAVANAPDPGVAGQEEKCAATRALLERVDWDCEVETNFAERHLSQTERIESGIDWALERHETAIVLEDDCVPDPSFFGFCDEMLERYRDEPRVMTISGDNFQFDRRATDDSYYFSRYPATWGWATWRRAWALNDPEMKAWPELRDRGWLDEIFNEPDSVAYWSHVLESNFRDRDAWDHAWLLSCWIQGGLHAIPNVNLVSNIGFREDATHTSPKLGLLLSDLPTEPMEFPLAHPPAIHADENADRYTDRLLHGGSIGRMFGRIRRMRRLPELSA
jgi:hypothetical protein